MNFNKGDEASFYKIILSDSPYLRLPYAFANKFLEKGENKKQIVILKTAESGVEWRVKYLRIGDRYYFMGSWLKFKNQNRVEVGDFLVFWLRSPYPNPIFEVYIFSPNGCLKNTASSSVHLNSFTDCIGNEKISLVEEETRDIVSMETMQEPLTLWRDVKESYKYRMPLTSAFVEAAGINDYGNLRLENKDGKTWDVIFGKYVPSKTPIIGRGWFGFLKDNKVKIGNSCVLTHVQDNLVRVHEVKKRGRTNGLKSKGR
ncbi:B3 domain-containing protein REM5-like [Bidens hawaiensis]|uniref:B3 domain-containing protein REM5-like n=1 Tax=Bidens hawaiensis TaxID=980011 RepID=UPI0040497E48